MGMFDELQQLKEREEQARQSVPGPKPPTPPRSRRPLSPTTPVVPSPVPPTEAPVVAVVVSDGPLFDLSSPADRTNTYSFSKDELWALDDLLQELDRQYDIQVTRYNLV